MFCFYFEQVFFGHFKVNFLGSEQSVSYTNLLQCSSNIKSKTASLFVWGFFFNYSTFTVNKRRVQCKLAHSTVNFLEFDQNAS